MKEECRNLWGLTVGPHVRNWLEYVNSVEFQVAWEIL
jgi:hypothetical protein